MYYNVTGQSPCRAGEEPGQLGDTRKRLLFFLETSSCYTPERLLAHFPFDGIHFNYRIEHHLASVKY